MMPHTLELKKDKATDYVLSWKSNGLYASKFEALYSAFLHSIKLSEFKMGIKFDKSFTFRTKKLLENVYIGQKLGL